MTIEVVRYSSERSGEWNDFNRSAKSGCFLFDRNFLSYHGERFSDASLMAYDDGKLIGMIAAAELGERDIVSHPGATFGGLILSGSSRSLSAVDLLESFQATYRGLGYRALTIKLMPYYLTSLPAGEVDYALWRAGFSLFRRDLTSIVNLSRPVRFNSNKRRAIVAAKKADLSLGNEDLAAFHALLTTVLRERHDASPVHSLAELALLVSRFPHQIRLRTASLSGEVVAGLVLFDFGNVVHTQYLAASPEGREVRALDLLIANAIEDAQQSGASWFSFGVSTVSEGRDLNSGLLYQKESFGGRAAVHDFMRRAL